MNKRLFSVYMIILTLGIFVSCTPVTKQIDSQNQIKFNSIENLSNIPVTSVAKNPEVLKIYKTVFLELTKDSSSTIVVVEKTEVDYKNNLKLLKKVLNNLQKEIPEIPNQVIDNFIDINKDSVSLKNILDGHIDVSFISKEDLIEISNGINGKDWEFFYKTYPKFEGIIILSEISFDSSGKNALVYYSKQKGSLDGIAYYIWLERIDNNWSVKNKFKAWAS